MTPTESYEVDAQDQAEVFDEDHYDGDGSSDMMTLEEMPDVYDVTSAVGDSDDDDAVIGEELDDDEIVELQRDEEDDEEDDEEESQSTGPSADDVADESDPHQEDLLDQGVEETFPASDPVSVKRIT